MQGRKVAATQRLVEKCSKQSIKSELCLDIASFRVSSQEDDGIDRCSAVISSRYDYNVLALSLRCGKSFCYSSIQYIVVYRNQ